MPSPFPGMDPYLEAPGFWPDFHHTFITTIRSAIQPVIRPKYHARIQERVYVEAPDEPDHAYYPDVTLIERQGGGGGVATVEADAPVAIEAPLVERCEPYLEIFSTSGGRRVVTIIELLSPSNKAPGVGRDTYRRKQDDVLRSDVNLVEIDLLRDGAHTVAVPESCLHRSRPYHYLISISRPAARWRFQCYFRTVRDKLPRMVLPLDEPDPDSVVDLRKCLDRCYEEGDYAAVLDYGDPPEPALGSDDADWATSLLAEQTPH